MERRRDNFLRQVLPLSVLAAVLFTIAFAQTVPFPAYVRETSERDRARGEEQNTETRRGSAADEEADAEEDDGENEGGWTRRGKKPNIIRSEERDRLEEESALREQVGRNIERTCEWLADQGKDCNFEELRENAIQQIEGAAQLYTQKEEQTQEVYAAACFREDCTTTTDRAECAFDQSICFGMPSDAAAPQQWGEGEDGWESDEEWGDDWEDDEWEEEWEDEDEWGEFEDDLEDFDPYQYLYDMPSDDDMMDYYGSQYGPPPSMRHGSGPLGPGGFPQDFGMDMKPILAMMEKMVPKLAKVIAIFEREGVTVPEQSRAVAANTKATFERLKGPCGEGDMNACIELGNTMGSIEPNMRPPMEKAMQEAIFAGKISFDRLQAIVTEIETMMNENMDGMMGPPGMHGPPPGMDPYGPPSGSYPGGMDYGPSGYGGGMYQGSPYGGGGYGGNPYGGEYGGYGMYGY